MNLPQSDVVAVIYALLPGFLAAWIFYGLTAHPKTSPFERVVQALIFTGIVHAIVLILQKALVLFSTLAPLGGWTSNVAFVWSILVAIIVGLIFSTCANKDWFHCILRSDQIPLVGAVTRRTSFPSEWFSTFNREKRYVVLHLVGSRRLYGWPYEWPDSPDVGHFVVTEPEWLTDDNQRIRLHTVEQILIRAVDVEMVELLKNSNEVGVPADAVVEDTQSLVLVEERQIENGQYQSN